LIFEKTCRIWQSGKASLGALISNCPGKYRPQLRHTLQLIIQLLAERTTHLIRTVAALEK
jgi:hypothetical protein